MNPKDVKPKDWTSGEIIFHDLDNTYSAIFGTCRGTVYNLGIRWDGETEIDRGYPGQADNPLWFVVPAELTYSMSINMLSI